MDELLDDLIFQTSEIEEKRKQEANNLREREEALLESGGRIRYMAVARSGTKAGAVGERRERREEDDVVLDLDALDSVVGSEYTLSSNRKRRRRMCTEENSGDEMEQAILKDQVPNQKFQQEN